MIVPRAAALFRPAAFLAAMLAAPGVPAQDAGDAIAIELGQDGSWRYAQPDDAAPLPGSGARMMLLREEQSEDGEDTVRRWRPLAIDAGTILVAVDRSLEHPSLEDADTLVCSPVVAVRNLMDQELFRISVGIRFLVGDRIATATSLMIGPLDPGEQAVSGVQPLSVDRCLDARGEVYVEACYLSRQIDCSDFVVASSFGAIPLTLAENAGADDN